METEINLAELGLPSGDYDITVSAKAAGYENSDESNAVTVILKSMAEKLTEIAENTPKVYASGYEKGSADGIKSEHDLFWDDFQNYGNRTDYINTFSYSGWTEANFRPKYNIFGTSFNGCFVNTRMQIDLVSHLEALDVLLDTSQATAADSMFNGCFFTHVGVIDLRNCNEIRYTFAAMHYCRVIDKIILRNDGTNILTDPFISSARLEEVRIEGTIGSNADLRWSTNLSRASIESILAAADRFTGTDSTFTVTLSLAAVNRAFESTEGANDGSTTEAWLSLPSATARYTISLI